MTKRYDEPIEVRSEPQDGALPLAFRWRGRSYEVARWLGSWRETRPPAGREYHRLLARPLGVTASGDLDADGFMVITGAVYDIYRELAARDPEGATCWRLARVWD